ncbi:MAG: hypothetical protein H7301_10005 [Cryobacterium sp.]|nr:hypothetical protein [Oligoflexia bacterium]
MVSIPGNLLRLFLLLIFSSTSYAAAPLKVALPCGNKPYVTCDVLKKRLIEGDKVKKQVGFRTMVDEVLSGIYEGKIDVKSSEGRNGSRVAFETVGKPPICLPLKLTENACKDEFRTNVKSEACPPLTKVGQISRDKYFYGLSKSTRGSLETAHMAGGMAMGISNQAIELEASITANSLVVSGTSGCYTRAKILLDALKAQTDVKLLAQVEECEAKGTDTCSSKKYFESGMETLHSAYLYLAKCQMIEDAALKNRKFGLAYVSRIETEIVQVCFARHRGYPAAMKDCYASEYAKWIRMRAKNEFPNLVSVCGN